MDSPRSVMFPVDNFTVGGAQQQLLELVRGLDKARFKPLVAPLYSGGPLEAEFKAVPGVEIVALDRKGKYDFSTLAKVARLLRRRKVDIVQPFLTPATLFGLLPAMVCRTPVKIVTERSGLRVRANLGHNLYRSVEDWLSRFADWVVPNSEAGRQFLIKRGISPTKIRVIPNGINLQRLRASPERVAHIRAQLGLEPSGRVVGILASLTPAKDHHTFLQAAALIARALPETKFAIVGDGPLRLSLEGQARALGLTTRVAFFGNQKEVGAYLSSFDVVVLTSVDLEGCSNAILEAMALGKPVVATNVGGNRELVFPEETGLLVPVRSPEAVAQAVLSLLQYPHLGRQMGQKGQEMVLARFTLEKMVGNYEALYDEAIERKLGHQGVVRCSVG